MIERQTGRSDVWKVFCFLYRDPGEEGGSSRALDLRQSALQAATASSNRSESSHADLQQVGDRTVEGKPFHPHPTAGFLKLPGLHPDPIAHPGGETQIKQRGGAANWATDRAFDFEGPTHESQQRSTGRHARSPSNRDQPHPEWDNAGHPGVKSARLLAESTREGTASSPAQAAFQSAKDADGRPLPRSVGFPGAVKEDDEKDEDAVPQLRVASPPLVVASAGAPDDGAAADLPVDDEDSLEFSLTVGEPAEAPGQASIEWPRGRNPPQRSPIPEGIRGGATGSSTSGDGSVTVTNSAARGPPSGTASTVEPSQQFPVVQVANDPTPPDAPPDAPPPALDSSPPPSELSPPPPSELSPPPPSELSPPALQEPSPPPPPDSPPPPPLGPHLPATSQASYETSCGYRTDLPPEGECPTPYDLCPPGFCCRWVPSAICMTYCIRLSDIGVIPSDGDRCTPFPPPSIPPPPPELSPPPLPELSPPPTPESSPPPPLEPSLTPLPEPSLPPPSEPSLPPPSEPSLPPPSEPSLPPPSEPSLPPPSEPSLSPPPLEPSLPPPEASHSPPPSEASLSPPPSEPSLPPPSEASLSPPPSEASLSPPPSEASLPPPSEASLSPPPSEASLPPPSEASLSPPPSEPSLPPPSEPSLSPPPSEPSLPPPSEARLSSPPLEPTLPPPLEPSLSPPPLEPSTAPPPVSSPPPPPPPMDSPPPIDLPGNSKLIAESPPPDQLATLPQVLALTIPPAPTEVLGISSLGDQSQPAFPPPPTPSDPAPPVPELPPSPPSPPPPPPSLSNALGGYPLAVGGATVVVAGGGGVAWQVDTLGTTGSAQISEQGGLSNGGFQAPGGQNGPPLTAQELTSLGFNERPGEGQECPNKEKDGLMEYVLEVTQSSVDSGGGRRLRAAIMWPPMPPLQLGFAPPSPEVAVPTWHSPLSSDSLDFDGRRHSAESDHFLLQPLKRASSAILRDNEAASDATRTAGAHAVAPQVISLEARIRKFAAGKIVRVQDETTEQSVGPPALVPVALRQLQQAEDVDQGSRKRAPPPQRICDQGDPFPKPLHGGCCQACKMAAKKYTHYKESQLVPNACCLAIATAAKEPTKSVVPQDEP
eukprot:jgi/Botrbrau1/18024/Bobra.0062s0016.2